MPDLSLWLRKSDRDLLAANRRATWRAVRAVDSDATKRVSTGAALEQAPNLAGPK